MYNTTKNLAKILLDHNSESLSGKLNMRGFSDCRKPTKIEKCVDELTAFAEHQIDEMEDYWYERWRLVDENTMKIFYRKSIPNSWEIDPTHHEIIVTLLDTIEPPKGCESFQYNTPDDLTKYDIGDTLTLAFQNKHYVKKDYRGKEIEFKILGLMKHHWRRPTQRMCLVPVNKLDNYRESDILYLDDTDRFICLMIDLFECNRIRYRGWRSKLARITTETKKPYDFTTPSW